VALPEKAEEAKLRSGHERQHRTDSGGRVEMQTQNKTNKK
jgi:hypothetical protein